jgi:hypothetical protein
MRRGCDIDDRHELGWKEHADASEVLCGIHDPTVPHRRRRIQTPVTDSGHLWPDGSSVDADHHVAPLVALLDVAMGRGDVGERVGAVDDGGDGARCEEVRMVVAIGSSGIATAAVLGLLLDNLIPGTPEERGLSGA